MAYSQPRFSVMGQWKTNENYLMFSYMQTKMQLVYKNSNAYIKTHKGYLTVPKIIKQTIEHN